VSVELSANQIAEMNEQGFTILPGVFGHPELARLDAALTEFWETTRRDINPREVIFGQKVAERNQTVCEFAQRQEFVDISTTFLGPDVDLYFNQMVYKSPEGNKPFSWHQDDAYGPVDPSPYLTVWMAISDATPKTVASPFCPDLISRVWCDTTTANWALPAEAMTILTKAFWRPYRREVSSAFGPP